MKRFLLILLAIVMAVTLCSCGGDKKEDTKKTEGTAAVSSTEKVDNAATASTAEKVETTQSESSTTTESKTEESAPKTTEDLLVGTWEPTTQSGKAYPTLTFEKNGGVRINGEYDEDVSWRVQNGKFMLKEGSREHAFEFHVTETELSIVGLGDYGGTIHYLRIVDKVSDELVSGDYKYFMLGDGTAEISGYSGNAKNLTIPSKLDDVLVSVIGKYAFKDCGNLVSVTLPDTVTSISEGVFYNCDGLVNATLSSNLTGISAYAFYGCNSLSNITIPNGVSSIGDYAFTMCSSITEITIPGGVTSIGKYVCVDCSSLTSVTIPSSVTSIGSYAFEDCSALKALKVSKDSYAELYCKINGLQYTYKTTENKSEESISKTPEELIVGTWVSIWNENRRAEDQILTITFYADGKVGGTDEGITWRIEKDQLIISETGHNDIYHTFYVTETQLALTGADIQDEILVFTRGSDESQTNSSSPKATATPKPTEYVTFGYYPQTSSGNDRTEIEWLVLTRDGDKALLLSRYALDCKPYNTAYMSVTWETCSLRQWLNDEFFNAAFSASEQQQILTTKVDNSESQGFWSTNGGNNTEDKVFLLSYAEANHYFDIIHYKEDGATNNMKSRTSPTAYAIAQGTYTDSSYKTSEGAEACVWRLRSPGRNQDSSAIVSNDGSLRYYIVSNTVIAIRPAVWVDFSLKTELTEQTTMTTSSNGAQTAELSAAPKSLNELIVGTWVPVGNENRRAEDQILTITFYADGKVGGTDEGITWRIEKDQLIISETGHNDLYYTFSVTETQLTISVADENEETLIFTRGSNESQTNPSSPKATVIPEPTGYVSFGHYPQQTSSGDDSTEIEWLVLTQDGDKALLLSRYALDCKPYNTTYMNVTWETCSLRQWLNEEFYNTAFSMSEQEQIITTTVDNSQSQGYWSTNGGNNTEDKVFLLSYAEANRYLNVMDGDDNNKKSRTSLTAYAIKQGRAYTNNGYKTNDGQAAYHWWLRSPGFFQNYAALVYNDGSLRHDYVSNPAYAVRPAVWVDFSLKAELTEQTTMTTSSNGAQTAELSTAPKTPNELIVGTWVPVGNENRSTKDKILTLTFYADGKVGGTDEGITWRIENDKLVISETGHNDLYYAFSVTETQLTLTGFDPQEETLVYTRGSNESQTTSSTANDTTATATVSSSEKVETTQSESGNTTGSETESDAPKTPSELIVGTWVTVDAVNDENEPVYNFMTFTGDGFAFSGNGDGYERTRYTIAWKIENDKLELTLTDINYGDTATRSFDFTLTEDELTISNRTSEDEESTLFKGARQNPQIAGLVTRASGIITSGDYSYCKLVNDTAEIIKYSGTAAELEIPAEFDGLKISVIGREAFEECDNLVKVTIPDCVTSIGKNAFRYCESLTEINMPGSVTSIGEEAFSYCSGLTCVTIPNSVTSIGEGIFYECESLKKVTLSEGITCIVENMFCACKGLTDITIPDSVTIIESSAFSYCESLANIIIPDSVTEIGSYAFWGCERLESITIPSSVTTIGSDAFTKCGKKTEYRFTVIWVLEGSYAEEYCKNEGLRYAYYEKEDTKKTDDTAAVSSTEKVETAAASTPAPTLNFAVGSTVIFGHFEQDNDLTNGEEPIEWIVLEKNDDGEYLLISKYGLINMPYDARGGNRTWESSTSRRFLNGEFYNNAFNESEKTQIVTTKVSADKNPKYLTDPGKITYDEVFLLSMKEALNYFNSNDSRMCVPTEHAKANGVFRSNNEMVDGQKTCVWWLRTPGVFQEYALDVSTDGSIYYNGSDNSITYYAIRPAVWVRISENSEIKQADKPDISTDPGADPSTDLAENDNDTSKYKVGDIVIFGHYEQDNDKTNGEEPIEWIVLNKKENEEYLLLSKYALDCKPYNTSDEDITWEECTLRTWLNEEFYNASFSVSEQGQILMTEVDNSQSQCYSDWNTSGGNNTQDKVFLLSYGEANRYLNVKYSYSSNMKSRTSPTPYAKARGVDNHLDRWITSEDIAACEWWLRSPGGSQYSAAYVYYDGSLHAYSVIGPYLAVRPAVWVNLESFTLELNDSKSKDKDAPKNTATPEPVEYVTFGHYPQTSAGDDNTEIEWLVLARDGNKALLLSRYALDWQMYNNTSTEEIWYFCTLRKWLNKDFINKAFTSEEQEAILMTEVDNSRYNCYSGWDASGGYNTNDKVFLLSYAEANRYLKVQFYSKSGAKSNTKSRTSPTAYAIKQGAYMSSDDCTDEGAAACQWWLRSPGKSRNDAAIVCSDGSMNGISIGNNSAAIRPALWVNLESLSN